MAYKVKFNFNALSTIKQEIAIEVEKYVKRRIRNGFPPPLKRPRRDGTTHTPLFHTGMHLHDSVEASVSGGGIKIGSNFIGARVLHNGGRGVPPRKYLAPDDKMIKIIKDIIERYI